MSESDIARDQHDIFNLFALVRRSLTHLRQNMLHISHLSLALDRLVTRHCVDTCKLRLGQGREWIRRGSVLDWKLLYGILVGNCVILYRRSHLGGMGSDLCQESERHHQGTILLCMHDMIFM